MGLLGIHWPEQSLCTRLGSKFDLCGSIEVWKMSCIIWYLSPKSLLLEDSPLPWLKLSQRYNEQCIQKEFVKNYMLSCVLARSALEH
jgi:hypothetical protein